jgi:RNA polymerase sigma-70 factor (ECF subfamily)
MEKTAAVMVGPQQAAARETTLESLIQRIAVRDEVAMAELYDRTSSLVFGMARRMVRDEQAAEEVAHEVFLQVWKRACSFDPARGRASTWLLLLARSRSLDRMRATRARRDEEPLETAAAVAADTPGPDVEWAQTRRRQKISEALAQLSPPQRQAIAWAYYNGLSYSEVAASLGEPVGTIKTRIRLGMMRLRELLEPLNSEG